MQHGRIGIFRRPHNGVTGTVSRNAGGRSGIAESIAALEGGSAPELGVGDLERFNGVSDRAVKERAVEVGRHAEYSAAQHSGQVLVNVVAAVSYTHLTLPTS